MVEEKIYRWLVLSSGLVIMICLGVAYAWGVFLLPIAEEFGWERADTSLVASILLLTFSVFMVVAGFCEKKYGPRITAALGGIFVCAGWTLAYLTQSLWWLYITCGVLVGMGTGLGYLSAISAGIKWFPEKRGMIVGIIVFGFGFGSAFLAPLAARLILTVGWRATMLIYGCVFGVIITACACFLKSPPENWKPQGWEKLEKGKDKTQPRSYSPAQMIKTGIFKLMFTTYFFSMVAGMMAITHIAAFIKDKGYTAMQAAFTFTILAICNGVGRPIWGFVSDKIGVKQALSSMFGALGLVMLFLHRQCSLPMIYIMTGVIGICFGGFLAVYPLITIDFFGLKHFGVNYGLVFLGYGAGCFLGPWLGGLIYDATGSYLTAFNTAGILALAGGLLAWLFLNPPECEHGQ